MRGLWIAVGSLASACATSGPSRSTARCGDGWTTLTGAALSRAGGAAPSIEARPDTRIEQVRLTGAPPGLADTLRTTIATRPGTELREAPLRDDLRRLWSLGVLADARVELDGAIVEFVVEPRAIIGRVVTRGGDADSLRRFRWLAGGQYEPARLIRMAAALEQAYRRDGRLDAAITIGVHRANHARRPGEIDVCVATRPGPRVAIRRITFPGRRAIPAADLLGAIHGEQARVNRPGGAYDPDALTADKPFLGLLYWDRGFALASIGDPVVTRRGDQLDLAIPIEEGPLFVLGEITANAPLGAALGLVPGERFSRARIAAARAQLEQRTGATVEVSTRIDPERRRIDLAFAIAWRWPWHAWQR